MWILFQSVITVCLLGIQYFCYKEYAAYAETRHVRTGIRSLVRGLFLLANVPLLLLLIWWSELSHLPGWFILATVYPLYLWHSSWALVFLVVGVKEAIMLPVRALVRVAGESRKREPLPHEFDPRRRVFIGKGMTVLAGAAFSGSVMGALDKDRFEVTSLTVPVQGLPPEFDGFSIALASDIHSSVFMTRATMGQYVTAINGMGADCIAVTGDFVNSQVEEVYPFAEAFAQLKAPHGVYGVLGNHDYYTRNVDAVAREVVDCGIRLLVNEGVTIRRGNASIYLLGADDTGSHDRAAQWFDRASKGVDAGVPKILMCHRPYHFQQAADRHIALTLSGHTHGGQFVLARIGNDVIAPARIASPYVAGLYSLGSSRMYVSRGIGTVGIPVRINCPPEITKLTLVRSM